jgi:hypothetical protein
MAKIVSGELHRNENSSMQFSISILLTVQQVRSRIADLAKSRKADEYVPGAIFALKKLCAGEAALVRSSGHVIRQEVEEWRTALAEWFRRVQRHYPDACAAAFEKNLEQAFRVILKCAVDLDEYFWRDRVDEHERQFGITFPSREALDAALKAADEKYPVHLGNALDKYLKRCIAELVDETAVAPSPVPQAVSDPSPNELMPRFRGNADGTFTLLLDDFGCYDSPEDLAQDIDTNAYDLEETLQRYLAEHRPDLAADLRLESESSLFCVRSARWESLVAVTEVLMRFASDREVYVQYRIP